MSAIHPDCAILALKFRANSGPTANDPIADECAYGQHPGIEEGQPVQIRFANHRSTAFQLHYDRNGTVGGLNIAVGSNVLVTLDRNDAEHPVELSVTDAGIVVSNERATADSDRPD